jgi:hypothetical protein
MGRVRNAHIILVGKPEGMRPLGRPGHRWEDNIRMDLREIGWEGVNWINLSQDRDPWQTSCEDGSKPLGSIKGGKFLD